MEPNKQVIGIHSNECFVCGKKNTTRHHVIPKAIKPLRNVTIPLCLEHKDVCHPIVKQLFIPRQTRGKLNQVIKQTNELFGSLKSLKKSMALHKLGNTTRIHSNPNQESILQT